MRQVQVNLVNDKLTNELGEKILYNGLYNKEDNMYYVFNSENPHKLLALSDLDVENVKNTIINEQLNFGKGLVLLEEFGKSTRNLKSLRLTKKEFETTASLLGANEANLGIEELVLEYMKLSKYLSFYKHALTQIPLLKSKIEQQQKDFRTLVKESPTLPTHEEYLAVLLDGTTAVVNDKELSLKFELSGQLTKVLAAIEEVEFDLLFGTLDPYLNVKGAMDNLSITYELKTGLEDKWTLGYAKDLNSEMKVAIKQLQRYIVNQN